MGKLRYDLFGFKERAGYSPVKRSNQFLD